MTEQTPFDLEYRPVRFADVLGNAGIVKLLRIRSQKGVLASRSMMFGGPKGSGKTSLARVVARAIVCDALEDGEPCNACPGCKSIRDESADSVDEFDAATQGTVERMRSIVEDLEYGTVSGKARVIVLDEAHRLSKASQDALLKSMEERNLLAILCTTEPNAIKTAIRSRVDEYPVSYPPEQELVSRLGKVCADHKLVCELDALELIVAVNGRCPRTSLTMLQSVSLLGDITLDNVKQVSRFGSLEGIVRGLHLLPTDPRAAVTEFDALFDQEGPTWVRDQILLAISSAIRSTFGAKPVFPVPSDFWNLRGKAWLGVAQSLSMLDRPNQADVEAIIYADVAPVVAAVPPPVPAAVPPPAPAPPPQTATPPVPAAPPQAAPPPAPAPPPQAALQPAQAPPAPAPVQEVTPVPKLKAVVKETLSVPEKPRSMVIDEVLYTSNEELTSMDSKIVHGSSRPADSEAKQDVRVERDPDPESVPMTQKEFKRGFLERLRS